ncbi:hypothetical protein L6164_001642 [Bauhinia variegata]|uniref:Uncharacterized protein n=1 Tax=Bauhinia variegata TaxID=167791 RepID=A0ACB9QCG9_BAUVA|nr:hypothetical protein L6164_001642 [Bauhinia variegata]
MANEFDPKTYDDPKKPICIADLGCSTGPNTFVALQCIIETIEHQYKSQGLAAKIPEFQVFFNDIVSNDFNTLFQTLPPNRNYFVAGVPGSFRGRLFPRESLHFINSSSTLNWLSKVPTEITDRTSAWNKGKIHVKNAPKEVIDAYATQYKMDFEDFLHARAEELVSDGLMALLIPAAAVLVLDSDIEMDKVYELLGSCLLDMTKEGLVSEEKVDSFNLPIYHSPVKHIMAILERNECFSIEQVKTMNAFEALTHPNVHAVVSMVRATKEGFLERQFGGGIIDELFLRFTKKVVEYPANLFLQNMMVQMVVNVSIPQSPMKGGEGPHSYAKNSNNQRAVIDGNKELIQKVIASEFDPQTHCDPKKPICITDLGCSTGPNTFLSVQYIIETIENQYQSQGLAAKIPEFQVFFNDLVSNDFNTLFQTLPSNRNYFASGVPGSFRGLLFPRERLHFINSSSTLNWLSKVPKEITDRTSAAWNKGRIHYRNAPKEVVDAYATQYKMEFENFLRARAEELVSDGLMALQIPAAADLVLDSDIDLDRIYELLGSCLLDMAKEGLVSEEKVDSFNLPIYYSPVKNVMAILERNEYCFRIEQVKILNVFDAFTFPNIQAVVSGLRATVEGFLERQFGGGIIDELFRRFTKKVVEYPANLFLQNLKVQVYLLVILKRKPHS